MNPGVHVLVLFPAARLGLAAALILLIVLAMAASAPGAIQQPDKLVILSTTDVKGKTSPCG
jgi:hypothetical protein